MRGQLRFKHEVMRDIDELFSYHSRELNKIAFEDGDEEDPRSLWTIEIMEIQ